MQEDLEIVSYYSGEEFWSEEHGRLFHVALCLMNMEEQRIK